MTGKIRKARAIYYIDKLPSVCGYYCRSTFIQFILNTFETKDLSVRDRPFCSTDVYQITITLHYGIVFHGCFCPELRTMCPLIIGPMYAGTFDSGPGHQAATQLVIDGIPLIAKKKAGPVHYVIPW